MKPANRIFTGLFLIIALILIIQPASATTQSYFDPGYSYEIGYVASGAWQAYDLVVTSTDDYDILALAYNHVNNFDLYIFDTTTNTYITSATAPYSTENGIDYIWAISTLKPGTYSVRIHSNSGAGNFAFIHFYNRQPVYRSGGAVNPDKLVALLPAAPDGWVVDGKPEGFTMTESNGNSWTMATGSYTSTTNKDTTASITYQDTANQNVGFKSSWSGLQSMESTDGYFKSVMVKGHPAWEMYSKPDTYGGYISVNDRFMVLVSIERGTKADYDTIMNAIDFAGIAALK